MILLLKALILYLVLCLPIDITTNTLETQQEVSPDTIEVKRLETIGPIVLVLTRCGTGSGTVIDKLLQVDSEVYEYRVLTNEHVVYSRWVTYMDSVDALTGKVRLKTIDAGCNVITFNTDDQGWRDYTARVVVEDSQCDLAVLSFMSKENLPVVKMADQVKLDRVRVFDEVIAVGCKFGGQPLPTSGIISGIIQGSRGNKGWMVYANTAQIVPGSSGGGLFKEYDGHYYLIGVPYSITVTLDGQLILHMAKAISLSAAIDFIESSYISN